MFLYQVTACTWTDGISNGSAAMPQNPEYNFSSNFVVLCSFSYLSHNLSDTFFFNLGIHFVQDLLSSSAICAYQFTQAYDLYWVMLSEVSCCQG